MSTIVKALGDFAAAASFDELPSQVVTETKRLILDSVGCAFAAVNTRRGRIGIAHGQLLGAGVRESTIIGSTDPVSVFGSAFANAELINALDFDGVLPPGHVTPYVLPGVLALGERERRSGRDLIVAAAVAHEMSNRIGKAMDYIRDVVDGVVTHPPVFGYSSCVLGAAAANSRMLGHDSETTGHAIAVAATSAPVNSMWSASQRKNAATANYALVGNAAVTALTASHLAGAGHTGDIEVLDDREYGFARFMGSSRWEPGGITEELGETWNYPREQAYKLYPHCRVPAALMDAMTELVQKHGVTPDQIARIDAWGEPHGMYPVWSNATLKTTTDALNSIAFGLSISAHNIQPVRRWHDEDVIFSSSVQHLMEKVTFQPHPNYVEALTASAAGRPSRLEVTLDSGEVLLEERNYPRGGPSPDPSTFITTDELLEKFRENAQTVLSEDAIATLEHQLMTLEDVDDLTTVMSLARPSSSIPTDG